MKPLSRIFVICAAATILLLCTGLNYPPSILGEKLDAAWREGREAEIPGMIETHLVENPGNPLALLLGYYYYLACAPDLEKKLAYRTQLEIKLKEFAAANKEMGSPPALTEFANGMFMESCADAQTQTNDDFTTVAYWKKSSPETFPFRLMAEEFAFPLGYYDPAYRKEIVENHTAWREKKLSILTEIGIEKLREDTLQFIAKSGETSSYVWDEPSWPESFKTLKANTIFCHPTSVKFLFWRILNFHDGVIVFFDNTEPEDKDSSSYYERYMKLADHIYWYSYQE